MSYELLCEKGSCANKLYVHLKIVYYSEAQIPSSTNNNMNNTHWAYPEKKIIRLAFIQRFIAYLINSVPYRSININIRIYAVSRRNKMNRFFLCVHMTLTHQATTKTEICNFTAPAMWRDKLENSERTNQLVWMCVCERAWVKKTKANSN